MQTRPYLDPTERRECRLYRIYGLDPRTNNRTITLIYIGETGREPFVRFIEHLYEQPFGDTIVGLPQVDPRVFTSKEQVWAAERAAIEAERPLYNYEHNGTNPHRVPIPEARRQRWVRDDAAGRPRWQPGERTQLGGGRVPMSQSSRHLRIPQVRWTRRRVRAVLLAGSWLVLAIAATVWFARVVSLSSAAMAGMIAATAVLLVGWGGAHSTRGRRRRRR